jgi:diguanylate cyclase
MADDDELQFTDDDVPDGASLALERAHVASWRVLIVDDDPDVHAATEFALRDVLVLDRPLQFFHANSAASAQALLQQEPDIAVIVLDVVMEQDDAGLRLVRIIRDELKLFETRIILRTGQPGYAPEMQAIRDYDINDYKTKSELTRTKLFTSLTSAIRSYDQIHSINRNRRSLDSVVRWTSELMALSGIHEFAAGAIERLAELLGARADGLICAQYAPSQYGSNDGIVVIAAAGRYADYANRSLVEVDDVAVRDAVLNCVETEQNSYTPTGSVLFLLGRERCRLVAFIDAGAPIDADSRALVDLLCANIAVGLDNTLLFARLHSHAYTDPLTSLPNRLSLIEQLDQRLGAQDSARYTLALIDIDHFAEANDALGHGFGDQLLRAVAQRLLAALGSRCQFSRISGDTFAALGLVEDLMPAHLLALFSDPFLIDGQEMMLTVTIGVAHLADIDGNGIDAVKGANIALRRAKTGHRGEYSFYTRDMAVDIRERVRLLQALRHAIERQRLFLVYQPQLELGSGKVCGIEALLRWRTEDGQLIPPDRFIPIAEHSGMIVKIGDWVMRMACFQQAELARHGFGQLRVGINVSVIQLRHPKFLSALSMALADSGADPSFVELEITESVAMEEADFISRMLDQIKALGVRIALDDFGTGFSSLSYLQRLNIDRLKIDRAFINDICSHDRARRIPELVIQLGQKLGFSVIAEGVEVQEQVDALKSMGCDEAQGYFYARPMEVPMLIEWLSARKA